MPISIFRTGREQEKVKTNYLRADEIERRANELITKYEMNHGRISAPVPVEKIAEHLLDLTLEWNKIPENGSEIIFAGLDPLQKKVIFNERRKDFYEKTDGLYNTVLAHEIGHWVLHIDASHRGNQLTLLPGTGVASKFIYRSTGPSKPIEWQAHSFMGYLVLPHKLLKHYIEDEDLCDWGTLYDIKETFDVTISALTTRLQRMGLIYVEDRQIYPCKAIFKGQHRLL